MNKVRATYKRLDYNNGDFLAHYQWRVMQDSVMFVWGLFQDDEDGMKIVRDEDWEKVITYCIDLLNEESVHGFDIIYCRISRDEKNKPTDKEVSNKQIQDNHKVSNSLVFYYPGFIEKLIFTAPSVKFENEIVITESLSYIKNMIPKETNITNDLVLFKDKNGDLRFCTMELIDDELVKSLSSEDQQEREKGYQQLSDHVRNNWPGCENNSVNQIMEENEILSTLKILSSYYRETQGVEFYANGFNYRINKNGELEKSNLSDYDINNGDFSNDAQYSQFKEVSRFYKDKDGFFQLSAYGIDNKTKIFDDKQINLSDLASEYRKKANEYLKLKEIKNSKQNVKEEESEAFLDGIKFKIANTCAFKLLSEVGGIGYTFVTTGNVEQQVYLADPKKVAGFDEERCIFMPPIFTGSVESVGNTFNELTDVAKFACNVVFDSEYRNDIPGQFADMGNKPLETVTDLTYSLLTGSDGETFTEFNDPKTDEGRKTHLGGKIAMNFAINTAEFVISGGATVFKTALKDVAKTTAKKSAKTMLGKLTKEELKRAAKKAIAEDKEKFYKGCVIEAGVYLLFYYITKEENTEWQDFPVADFLNDVILAGIDNTTQNIWANVSIGCLSAADMSSFTQALLGEGKYADDYNGKDKSSFENCISDAGKDCLVGAIFSGASNLILKRVEKTTTKVIHNTRPDVNDTEEVVSNLIDLIKNNILSSKLLRGFRFHAQRRTFKNVDECITKLFNLLRNADNINVIKNLHLRGFDFNNIAEVESLEILVDLAKKQFMPDDLIKQLKELECSDQLIEMIKLFKETGGSVDSVLEIFSKDLFTAYKEVASLPGFRRYFKKIDDVVTPIIEEPRIKCENVKGSCDFYFYIDDLDFSEVLNFSVKEIVLENIGTPLKQIGNVVVKTITSKNNK